ncbi:MAG TPA: ABC transporter permease [Candidatus Acidoferrales bacterium]
MGDFLHDVKYALRMFTKSPGFTAVALLTLALGIGANSTIFSVVNGVLLRPLPYEDAGRLALVWGFHPEIGRETASLPDFVDWREQNRSFDNMAASTRGLYVVNTGEEPERMIGARVTHNFFSVLGVQPVLGRTFLPEEDRPGAPNVVMLKQAMWEQRFGADPNVLGRTLEMNGRSYTIVGVAPSHLRLPSGVEFWVPLARDPAQAGRRSDFLQVYGRLKPGVTVEQAQADMNQIMAVLEKEYPATNAGWRTEVVSLHKQIVGNIRPALWVLMGAVGFVLLIACANVANLLLARATSRQREIAVRVALGAGRGRVVRQLLTESVLLALAGGVLGVLLATWGTSALVALSPADLPRLDEIAIDGRIIAFTAALALLTGLLFGLAPALQASRAGLNETLKEGGRGSTSGGGRLRSALVISEVALSVVLLVGAGLLIRNLYGLLNVDAGFDRSGTLMMRLQLPPAQYNDDSKVISFVDRLLEQVRALPGVDAAEITSPTPLTGPGRMLAFAIEGQPPPPPEALVDASVVYVSSGYHAALRIPVLAGRALDERDGRSAGQTGAHYGVISRLMAQRHFRNLDPIGQRITFGNPANPDTRWYTIVGVVGDVRLSAEEDAYPTFYAPYPSVPLTATTLLVRATAGRGAATEALSMAPAVRGLIRELDRSAPVSGVQTLDQLVEQSLASRQFTMLLLSLFAGVALTLAAVGIYGVMAYAVAQRTHEIGIRVALGAQRGDVMRLILGRGLALTFAGIAAGVVASLALSRVLQGLLVDVSATDPLTLAGVAAVLAAVAVAACIVPALRATRVDPIVALRYE